MRFSSTICLICVMIDLSIVGGFLFGVVLTITIVGTAIQEAKDRKKNDRLGED